MAFYEQRWSPGDPAAATRSERAGATYATYRADPLRERRFTLSPATARSIENASLGVAEIEATTQSLGNTEALGRLLLRAEAVGSSRIEGLEVGPRRLLRAEFARLDAETRSSYDVAHEVLGNIDAMALVVERSKPGVPLTLDALLIAHETLMRSTRNASIGGVIRSTQNWIGGDSIGRAEFVPPPPEDVPALLDELVSFINKSDLPAIAIAAVAHAQFETIHPFADGNGRIGRALIHMVLRQYGLIAATSPPISLILATQSLEYIRALTAFRFDGDTQSEEAAASAEIWIRLFADSLAEAAERVAQFEREIERLQVSWKEQIGSIRRDSVVLTLLEHLPQMPILNAATAQVATGRSLTVIQDALSKLVDSGIIHQVTVGKRNRAYEVPELIDAVTLLERRLASPIGDTAIAAPIRPVPKRPIRAKKS
ncbi:Fic family protein [soil metagenome]